MFKVRSVVISDLNANGTNERLGRLEYEETDLLDHSVDAHAHLFDAFTARASVLPDLPSRVLGLDFGGKQTLVLAVVPLPDLFGDNMGRGRVDLVE